MYSLDYILALYVQLNISCSSSILSSISLIGLLSVGPKKILV